MTILDDGPINEHQFFWTGAPGTEGFWTTGVADLSTNFLFVDNIDVSENIILNGGNIYNIPDTPVDISINGIPYDASYCPVNWNVFQNLSDTVNNLSLIHI